jgi:hypothetical protein
MRLGRPRLAKNPTGLVGRIALCDQAASQIAYERFVVTDASVVVGVTVSDPVAGPSTFRVAVRLYTDNRSRQEYNECTGSVHFDVAATLCWRTMTCPDIELSRDRLVV